MDLGVFLTESAIWATIWTPLTQHLKRLGYKTAALNDRHFRVYPRDPFPWSEYAALKSSLSSRGNLPRDKLTRATSKALQRGQRATDPHGIHVIDIEVYHVKPGRALRILATTPKAFELSKLFPTRVGAFGPLRLNLLNTDAILTQEYGPQCMTQRRAKIRGGATRWVDVPPTVRRSAWPTTAVRRADELLGIR
jgi:hypothetical protein